MAIRRVRFHAEHAAETVAARKQIDARVVRADRANALTSQMVALAGLQIDGQALAPEIDVLPEVNGVCLADGHSPGGYDKADHKWPDT